MKPATCSQCGLLVYAERMEDGSIHLCIGCGHALVFIGGELRDMTRKMIDDPMNREVSERVREQQEKFCLSKGWWG